MATDVAMEDMDIDFDLGDEDPEIVRLREEAAAINAVCFYAQRASEE